MDFLTTVGDINQIHITDRIAFVEMSNETQARDCISRFHRKPFRGTVLTVQEDVVYAPTPRVASGGRTRRAAVSR